MNKVPGSFVTDRLTKLDQEIQSELEEWNSLGMFLEGITSSNESILMVKMQIQTIINLLLTRTDVSEDDLNLEFKTIMLETLKELRDKFTPEAERRRIAAITGQDPNENIEVPQFRLLGPNGKPVEW